MSVDSHDTRHQAILVVDDVAANLVATQAALSELECRIVSW